MGTGVCRQRKPTVKPLMAGGGTKTGQQEPAVNRKGELAPTVLHWQARVDESDRGRMLMTLETNLTELLQRYEGETAARIQLSLEEKLPLPQVTPKIWLREDGFEGEVARKGHGLQRLFIFSILELYEKLRGATPGEDVGGNMVLAIEEPELYQHSARARSLARILLDLTTPNKDRPFRFQVFLTTHSPYFVGIDSFQRVRRVYKTPSSSGPMQTKVTSTTLKMVSDDVLAALGQPTDATELSSWARLQSVLGLSVSEGFFADGVILVEGDEDEAILAAVAESRGVSLDAAGIAVVSSGGKTKLPNLLALYRRLGIKTFTIFDADGQEANDADVHTETNAALLKMIGEPPQARPATRISSQFAVWDTTFVDVVKAAVGKTEWDAAFSAATSEYSIPSGQAKKKYAVIWKTMTTLLEKKVPCEPVEKLWSS